MTRKLLVITALLTLIVSVVPVTHSQDGVHVNLSELNRRADRIETHVDDLTKAVTTLTARQDDTDKRDDKRDSLLTGCFIALLSLVGERLAAVVFGARARNNKSGTAEG